MSVAIDFAIGLLLGRSKKLSTHLQRCAVGAGSPSSKELRLMEVIVKNLGDDLPATVDTNERQQVDEVLGCNAALHPRQPGDRTCEFD